MPNGNVTAAEEKPTEAISLKNLVSRDHKLYHLFNFIGENYGNNPADILRAITTILDFEKGLKSFFNGKKFTIKNVFNLFRYSLPASLYSIEMALKVKKYIDKIKQKELSEYDKKQKKLKEFLGLESENNLSYLETRYLNDELLFWLLKSPKTNGYKIIGYYNNSFELLNKISYESDNTNIFILIEHNKEKVIFDLNITKHTTFYYCEVRYIRNSSYSSDEAMRDLEELIIKDFILTFNIHDNILEYKNGISSRKRTKIDEKINQYDINPLIKEIIKILKYGRKRGWGFIGLQGTGKSIIIKKLEEILTDIIVIKLGPEEFGNTYRIKKCFQFIKIIQPALVIIEDLDGLGFKEKNERVTTFINEIDDSNNDLNIALIVTINDTELVHKTIIDRPGRFDEIIEIKPPQSENEIYEVMVSKFNKLKQFYTQFENVKFPRKEGISESLTRCLKNKFTQAELTCGIIEKVFINEENPDHPCLCTGLEKAITSFEASKKSLKTYTFNETEAIDDDDCKCDEAIEVPAPNSTETSEPVERERN